MSPHAPTIFIPLLRQPIVANDLGIEIEDFERRVMDVGFGALEDEEAVVIDEFEAAV